MNTQKLTKEQWIDALYAICHPACENQKERDNMRGWAETCAEEYYGEMTPQEAFDYEMSC